MTKKRLAIISTHPIQYQAPIWRALAHMPDLDVHVYYGSDFSIRGYRDRHFGVDFKWDVPLTDGHASTFLSTDSNSTIERGFFSMRPTHLRSRLRAFRPDCALISAYMPFFWWETVAVLQLLRIPTLLRAEATDTAMHRSALKNAMRNVFLRVFYRTCTKCLAIGQMARNHYLRHGVPPGQIGWSPYCVDTGLFEEQIQTYEPCRETLQRELGLNAMQTVFIYSGKIYPQKSPTTIVEALASMPEAVRAQLALLVVGDGELRSQFEVACHNLLGERAVFVGFANQSELGRYYAAADCLILPSLGETWGLVVNETMQFGLPAIVSDHVGCYPDLIVEGKTGYVFPAGDAQQLSACMLQAVDLIKADRYMVSRYCRSQVAAYSPQAAAEGIRSAVMNL